MEEFEESRRTKKSKTIKEEDEGELCESPKNVIVANDLSEKNPETLSNKSLLKGGARPSRDGSKKLGKKNLYALISNFYITKKFIQTLRNSTFYRRPRWLKPGHFRMINDWSFWFDGWKMLNSEEQGSLETDSSHLRQKKGFNVMLKKGKKFTVFFFKRLIELVPETFDPYHKFRVLWDMLHLMIIIFNLILTPIEVGFDLKNGVMENVTLQFFVNFSIGFFIMDIMVNLNTAFYDKGALNFSKSMIIRHYFSGPMLRDVLSFFSQFLAIFYGNDFMQYFDLLILLRFYNLKKIFVSIEEYIAVDEKLYNTLSLVKLTFGVFFMSHILACLWHFIGIIQWESGGNWLHAYEIESKEWYIRYIYSYYFVVISMNTVGYGDIVPQTVFERFFTIFIIFFACWIFAYTINSIGIILQDINRKSQEYIRSINLINGYMKEKNICFELQMRIRKYIQFIWQEEKAHNNLETLKVIDKLSKSLRQELLLQANGLILSDLHMFNFNFSEETLNKIVYKMKEVSFIPGDPIYFQNDRDDKSLYILRSGEVEIYVETPRPNDPFTVIKTVNKKGEVFGEYSFFSDKERESCARSATFTSVYMIKHQDALEIIKDNALDYQTFCQIKDQINLYQNFTSLYQKCPLCNENQHIPTECPMMHLVVCRSRIISRHNYTEIQKRIKGVPRKRLKICHALKNFEKHENLAQKLHQRLNFEEDEENETSDDKLSSDNENNIMLSKPSEENMTNNSKPDDSPKFKEINREEPEKKPILKSTTSRTLAAAAQTVLTQGSSESKSSLTLPGNEFIDRRPEANQPKFFAEMALASPKSKTQIVAFAQNKQLSSESLSVISNFSKRSRLDENKNKRKQVRSTTSDFSKKVSSSIEEDSRHRKSTIVTPRKITRENSGTFSLEKARNR